MALDTPAARDHEWVIGGVRVVMSPVDAARVRGFVIEDWGGAVVAREVVPPPVA